MMLSIRLHRQDLEQSHYAAHGSLTRDLYRLMDTVIILLCRNPTDGLRY